jgi:hypothetical protein
MKIAYFFSVLSFLPWVMRVSLKMVQKLQVLQLQMAVFMPQLYRLRLTWAAAARLQLYFAHLAQPEQIYERIFSNSL